MDINFTLSAYAAFAGTIRAGVYAADNPTAQIDFQDFAAPHTSPRAITFTGLDSKVHLVKIFALPSSTPILDWMHNPTNTAYSVSLPLFHIIGDGQPNTPAAGTNTYRNPDLEKAENVLKDFWVERRGVGTLKPTTEITLVQTDPNYGFDLANAGDVWADGELIVIHLLPEKVTNLLNESVTGKWFDNSFDLVGATVSYNVSHLKKLLLSRGSGSLQTYNLPDAANAPVGYVFAFSTYGSGYTSFKVASSTPNIDIGGSMASEITIGEDSLLFLIFNTDGEWLIIQKMADVGTITKSDDPNLNDTNVLATTVATKLLADQIKVIALGKFNIGDIGGGDPVYQVTFVNPNNDDYIVMGSFKSNSSAANHGRDNSIGWAWYKNATTPNTKFDLIVQELASETQNVEFCWVVLKV